MRVSAASGPATPRTPTAARASCAKEGSVVPREGPVPRRGATGAPRKFWSHKPVMTRVRAARNMAPLTGAPEPARLPAYPRVETFDAARRLPDGLPMRREIAKRTPIPPARATIAIGLLPRAGVAPRHGLSTPSNKTAATLGRRPARKSCSS